MKDISKSIVLGALTLSVWVVASIILNEDKKVGRTADTTDVENIDETFVETLTIDYKGATN